jgi:hypothetical protein
MAIAIEEYLQRAKKECAHALETGNYAVARRLGEEIQRAEQNRARDHYERLEAQQYGTQVDAYRNQMAQAAAQQIQVDAYRNQMAQAAAQQIQAVQNQPWGQMVGTFPAEQRMGQPLGNIFEEPFLPSVSGNHIGVPLWKGEPIADDWAGAKIASYRIEPYAHLWRVRFHSDFSDGVLELYLPRGLAQHEVDGAARSFMAMLNQRRILS